MNIDACKVILWTIIVVQGKNELERHETGDLVNVVMNEVMRQLVILSITDSIFIEIE